MGEHLVEYIGDSGSARTRRPHAWIWAVSGGMLLACVVLMQQFTRSLASQTLEHAPESLIASEAVTRVGVGEQTVWSKFLVKIDAAMGREGTEDQEYQADLRAQIASLGEVAITRTQRVRHAIVVASILGPEEGEARLEALAGEVEPSGGLASDVYWFRRVLDPEVKEIPPEVPEALIDRHGWYAKLAFTQVPRGAAGGAGSGFHREVHSGGMGIIVFMGLYGLAMLGCLAVGVLLVLITIVVGFQGQFESWVEAEKGASVYLEQAVVFVAGFLGVLCLGLVWFGIGAENSPGAMATSEIATWALAGAIAWPAIRGVSWSVARGHLGWNSGSGVGREVMVGVAGFLVALPVSYGVNLLVGLIAGEGGETEGPSGFPMFRSPESESWMLVWLGVLSATVWAPFVEETIFRGALYAYLHPYLRWWGTLLVTSICFGAAHPYGAAGLLDVAAAGLIFGLLREWRGSLIAPIVAHFLHNAAISGIEVGVLTLLGD